LARALPSGATATPWIRTQSTFGRRTTSSSPLGTTSRSDTSRIACRRTSIWIDAPGRQFSSSKRPSSPECACVDQCPPS
jgi:hypothetical protein